MIALYLKYLPIEFLYFIPLYALFISYLPFRRNHDD